MKKKTARLLTAAGAAAVLLGGGAYVWNAYQNRQEAAAYAETARNSLREGGEDGGNSAEAAQTVSYQGETYRYKEALENYLFLGIDRRSLEETEDTPGSVGQADAIYLLSRDDAGQTLQVLGIPRDTMTEIEVFDHQGKSLGTTTDHLNLQYAYGDGRGSSCRLMTEAVSKLLYQLPIDGYCAVQMDGIAVLNEAVGGTTVTVPEGGFESGSASYAAGETVTLQGDEAEAFVRHRDIEVSQSALSRMERQQIFMDAWVAQASERAASDAGFVTELYMDLEPYMVTDISNDRFAQLLAETGSFTRNVQTLPGTGSTGEQFDEYHVDEDALYELILEMYYEKVS